MFILFRMYILLYIQGQLTGQEDARRRQLCQLVEKEQEFAVAMQFGMLRFQQPLAERRDLISSNEHSQLFQNAQEVIEIM